MLEVPACFFVGEDPVVLKDGGVFLDVCFGTCVTKGTPLPVPNLACFRNTSRGGLASVLMNASWS